MGRGPRGGRGARACRLRPAHRPHGRSAGPPPPRPARRPHPDRAGRARAELCRTIDELPQGGAGVVTRISDADGDMLRWFADLGLGLDARVEVRARREFAGVVTVAWTADDGGPERQADLGLPAARAVWVDVEDAEAGE
ncbi:FeoA family protein [Flavimobilis soli]|uniref:FeoA family protein n=1 Tax=Flavimobilis soli TaxID=442709 RepID=UPI0031830779